MLQQVAAVLVAVQALLRLRQLPPDADSSLTLDDLPPQSTDCGGKSFWDLQLIQQD